LGAVAADIRKAIEAEIPRREGIRISYGGQFESAQSTRLRLLIAGGAITLLVVLLLLWMFHSVRDTLLVLANMPLALIGAVAGVYFSGGILTVASMIGFITVFGIAVRNGIMLVSHIRHLQQAEGVVTLRHAVQRAALERLSPILMTALAAGLALIPLALRSDEPGNEILSPMAIVILFGLLSSTALNMLLVPSFYLHWGRPQSGQKAVAPAMSVIAPVLMGLLMLGSCQQTPPRMDWAAAHTELEQTVGLAAAVGEEIPKAADDELLSALGDGLSLEEAMRLALLRSPRLRAGFHAVGASQAEFQQAVTLQNPRLALGWLLPDGGGRSQWSIDLLQPLADAWLREPRVQRARVEQDQALVDLSLAAREILCAARTAWFRTAKARAHAEIAAHEASFAEQRLAISRDQLVLGLIPDQAVAQEQWVHTNRILEMNRSRAEARQASRLLATCLVWEGSLEDIPLTFIAPNAELECDPDELLALATHSRLDLRAAALSIERSKADLELVRKGRWAGIEIGLSAERPAGAGSTLVGPAAAWEIPLNNRRAAAVAAAEQRLLEQESLRENLIAEARQEILALLERLLATRANLQQMEEQALPALERRMETLQAALAAGDITRVELIQLEADRLAFLRDHESARWLALELHMKLEEATGQTLLAAVRSTAPAPEPRVP
jgi:outer membrane protein TolC